MSGGRGEIWAAAKRSKINFVGYWGLGILFLPADSTDELSSFLPNTFTKQKILSAIISPHDKISNIQPVGVIVEPP